jgi:hypothetical protein
MVAAMDVIACLLPGDERPMIPHLGTARYERPRQASAACDHPQLLGFKLWPWRCEFLADVENGPPALKASNEAEGGYGETARPRGDEAPPTKYGSEAAGSTTWKRLPSALCDPGAAARAAPWAHCLTAVEAEPVERDRDLTVRVHREVLSLVAIRLDPSDPEALNVSVKVLFVLRSFRLKLPQAVKWPV